MQARIRVLISTVLALAASTDAASDSAPERYVYVTGMFSGDIAGYTVAANGALTAMPGSPFPGGKTPFNIYFAPDGRHLYVSSLTGDAVSAFAVGAGGALTEVKGSPYRLGSGWLMSGGIAVSPDGSHLYAGSGNRMYAFAIAPDGSLSPVPGSPFATNFFTIGPFWPCVSPNGKYLYGLMAGQLRAFRIAADGSLTKLGDPLKGKFSSILPRITPDGKHIYVSNESDGSISAYNVAANGMLSEVQGSPFAAASVPHGAYPSADGKFLYVPNISSKDITVYHIQTDGSLATIEGSPFAVGEAAGSLAIAADGRSLYLTSLALFGKNNLFTFSIDDGGSLRRTTGPLATSVSFADGPATAMTPNQGPVAAFTGTVAGRDIMVDASTSNDTDGSVARYDWSFGDGAAQSNVEAIANHSYARAGIYRVTLTVTDNEGCSTKSIFTGQAASCNGDERATVFYEFSVD